MPTWNEPAWLQSYARRSAELKGCLQPDGTAPDELIRTVETAFNRVYRAVAFDIDGTLTDDGDTKITDDSAQAIGALLRRGVHVILVTGRGEKSTRAAAETVRSLARISDWYARRLSCVYLNGVGMFTTPSEAPDRFLAIDYPLTAPMTCLDELHERLRTMCLSHSGVHLQRKTNSLRILFPSKEMLDALWDVVAAELRPFSLSDPGLSTSYGTYGVIESVVITTTNKRAALEAAALRLGLSPEHILRIGDRGEEHGNDFELLDSPAGFSVGELSKSPSGCLPVLDDHLGKILRAAEATKHLTPRLRLFPTISLGPAFVKTHRNTLHEFERLALRRARQEAKTVTDRLRVRLRYLVGQDTDVVPTSDLQINDIFDPRSGAVTFADWEFDAVADHQAVEPFRRQVTDFSGHRGDPRLGWAMYSDTSMLLRGPNYYLAECYPEPTVYGHHVEKAGTFLGDAFGAMSALQKSPPSLGLFKVLLGYLDNVRNILITSLYAAFRAYANDPHARHSVQVLYGALVRHTSLHLRILLDPDLTWPHLLALYRSILEGLSGTVPQEIRSVLKSLPPEVSPTHVIRKWRESDHFLKNVAAIQIGLHEFQQHGDLESKGAIIACGLAYGGTELPAIAEAIGGSRNISIEGALAGLSVYGDMKVGEQVRKGDVGYVEEYLLRSERICLLGSTADEIRGQTFILLDDNVTTGTTLQLARDLIVAAGGDVLGAIAVCFPGVNRQVQMAMDGHGLPDPDQLFGFIRGLVSPSPYARLLYARDGDNPYLDQTKEFDKARTRISRYLLKNGTPPAIVKP